MKPAAAKAARKVTYTNDDSESDTAIPTPAPKAPKGQAVSNQTANLGFEAKMWLAADKLRNNMDAAEYKHVVLGLIFLKYISDTFAEHQAKLIAGKGDYAGSNPEDADEYKAENIFWVPPEARWTHLQANAFQPDVVALDRHHRIVHQLADGRLLGVGL